jgi:RHS repeat-associated protein
MSTTLEQLQYGFDRDSRRVWRQRAITQGWDNAYAYDSLSQVIGDDRGDLNQAHNAIAGTPANGARWQYDETGNWHGYETLADGASTLSQSRTHDKGNRLMEVSDAAAMRTDRAGRMLETVPGPAGDWSKGYQITWDAWSRIVGVASVDGETITPVAAYAYDGTTRRITRYIDEEEVTLHSYYNDEWRPVEERKNSESTAAASYLWGSRHRDDLVRRDRAVGGTALNETRYILMDYFSPAAITDEEGEVTERYQFSAFGLRTILNPDFTVRSDSECGMEFSFQGQFEDIETGWMNYGYRYYLTALGRWACKDPIGIRGGINLYIASRNSLTNQVDFLGLAPVPNNTDNAPMNPTPRIDEPAVNPVRIEDEDGDGTGDSINVTATGRNLCDCDHDGKIIIELSAYSGKYKASQNPANRVTHNGEYKNRAWRSDKPGYEGLEGHTTTVIRPKCPEGGQSGTEVLNITYGSASVKITVKWSYGCKKESEKKCVETDSFQYHVTRD